MVTPVKYNLTQAQLKTDFHYDPETGVFFRRLKGGGLKPMGTPTNVINGNPYLKTVIKTVQYPLQRLIWLYVYGTLPIGRIIFFDGNGLNNKINNLIDQSANERQKLLESSAPLWVEAKKKWVVQEGGEEFEFRNKILAEKKAGVAAAV